MKIILIVTFLMNTLTDNDDTLYKCRVCGIKWSTPPWGKDGKHPKWGICACCGVEWGYEDCWLTSIRNYRQQWLNSGAEWFDPKKKPENWNLKEQLLRIPLQFL